MRTGFSLCSISKREKPVFITGIPANENRFFPVWKYYTRKTLFWPCTGPLRDCSVTMTEKQKQKQNNDLVTLHPSFCNPYFGPFFTGSQTDPCFQNKNSGCGLWIDWTCIFLYLNLYLSSQATITNK